MARWVLQVAHRHRLKEEADRLGLRTRRRVFPSGRVYGGVAFTRGRIYHLLSYPVYIGQIRHKARTHEGQHPPLVDRQTWEAVQATLGENAARARRRETAASPAPLAGKVVDETGDRLTPSHAVRRGRRHRYYVSHRLIARSGEKDLVGWRLPAATLENAVVSMICGRFGDSTMLARLVNDPTATDIASLRNAARDLVETMSSPTRAELVAALIEEGRLAPGRLSVTLDREALAKRLRLLSHRINPTALAIESDFTLRRRGIEARLVLEDAAPEIDHTLLRNVARGWSWFEEIKRGTPMQEIARRESLSQRRIARLVDLALLAPDIVEAIVAGRQPIGLTPIC